MTRDEYLEAARQMGQATRWSIRQIARESGFKILPAHYTMASVNQDLSVLDSGEAEWLISQGKELPEKREPQVMRDGKELVAAGYKQRSRKYRLVAKLPDGETGLEALKRCNPSAFRNIMDFAEHKAADHYRAYNAQAEGNELELTAEEFKAFREAGGT